MDETNKNATPSFAVVSEDEAKLIPYPYVYIDDDGTVRELHRSERDYLETPFHPNDGARPYTKGSYTEKDGWGRKSGFCLRSEIPAQISIADAPLEDPTKLSDKAFMEEQIKLAKEKGFDITRNADGTLTFRRKPKP